MTAIATENRALAVYGASATDASPFSNLLDPRLSRVTQTADLTSEYWEFATAQSVVGEVFASVPFTAIDLDVHPTREWVIYVDGTATLRVRRFRESLGEIDQTVHHSVDDAKNLCLCKFEPDAGNFVLVGRTSAAASTTPWQIYRFDPETGTIGAALSEPTTKTQNAACRGIAWTGNNESTTKQWFAVSISASPYINVFDLTLSTGAISNKANDPTLPGSAPSASGPNTIDLVYMSENSIYLAVVDQGSPFIHQYTFNPSASPPTFSLKYSNPSTLPAGAGQCCKYMWITAYSDSYLWVGHATSPFVSVYLMDNGSNGIGAKSTNPTTLPAAAPWAITFSSPDRTNLGTYPSELDNAVWTKTKTTISADAIAAPSGMTTADKLREDNTAGNHEVTRAITVTAAIPHCLSWDVQAAERSQLKLSCTISGNSFSAIFDLTALTATGSASGATAIGAAIEAVGGGWYRCWVSGVIASGTSMTVGARLVKAGSESYTGTTDEGLYLWGFQLEQGARPTVFRPYGPNGRYVILNRNTTGFGVECRLWHGAAWGDLREDIWDTPTSGTTYKWAKLSLNNRWLLTGVDDSVDAVRLSRFFGEDERVCRPIDIISILRTNLTQGSVISISGSHSRDQSSAIYTDSYWTPFPSFEISAGDQVITPETFALYATNLHYKLSSSQFARYWRITILDPANPNGALAAGYLFASLLTVFDIGHQYDTSYTIADDTADNAAVGGPVYQVPLPKRRRISLNLAHVTNVEQIQNVLQPVLAGGRVRRMLILPNENDRAARFREGLWARFPQGVTMADVAYNLRGGRLEFEELL